MFWGIVSVLVGALLGYVTVRNLFFVDWRFTSAKAVWHLASLVPFSAQTVYFVWLGKNELQRAGGQKTPKPQFRWGRLLLGSCLVFFALKGYFSPPPNALKLENAMQALGTIFPMMVMLTVGTMLMAYAFKPVKPKPDEKTPSEDAQ
jgi:hypothetical protein